MQLLKVYKLTSISVYEDSILELISFSFFRTSKYTEYCYYLRFYYDPSNLTNLNLAIHICHKSTIFKWEMDNIDNIFILK